jgi:hypothetical protein
MPIVTKFPSTVASPDVRRVRTGMKHVDGALSVQERIRYYNSFRSGHVYIVGHGHLDYEDIEKPVKVHKKKKKSKSKAADKQETKTVTMYSTGRGNKFAKGKAAKFIVPAGITIHFYNRHGMTLDDSIANNVEGFNPGFVSQIVETIKPGGLCWNYRLSYAAGLKVQISKARLKKDVIAIAESDQDLTVPLSRILKDSRCQNTEVHWLACRSVCKMSEGKYVKNHRYSPETMALSKKKPVEMKGDSAGLDGGFQDDVTGKGDPDGWADNLDYLFTSAGRWFPRRDHEGYKDEDFEDDD